MANGQDIADAAEPRFRRRLATILVGDVVGSTSAIEADEEGAVGRIARCLEAFAAVVAKLDGRVFSTAGDAALAEFQSPVNALRAAMEARSAIAAAPGAEAVAMRFGLHLADVIEVGADLRGDGVNLAAHIQAEAAPGEIFVSASLVEQVRRGSPCAFEEIGETAMKGVSEPVRLFRVKGPMDLFRFQSAPTRRPEARAARPHSVAVAPLRAASSADDDQRFLAEGITEDLILELARNRRLFVSSRSASFALDSADPVRVGAQLGVGYVLSGSVRKVGERLRLNLTLSETGEGRAIWSERIERPYTEMLDAFDEATARIAATVSGRIQETDIAGARRRPASTLGAYESHLRGLDLYRRGHMTDDDILAAVGWFRRAAEADSAFAAPRAMQVCAGSALADFDFEWGVKLATEALALDPHDPEVNRIMGSIRMTQGDFASARTFYRRALDLASNDAYVIARCAAFHVCVGEPERALELLDHADELDPFLPVWCVEERVAALHALGRFEAALDSARALPFQTRRSRLLRAASRMALGFEARARAIVAEALADDPQLTTAFVRAYELFEDRSRLDALLDLLREAGLPDPAPPAVQS